MESHRSNTSGTTKICRVCGEEIKAIAKKCPYCISYQSKTPNMLVIVFVIVMGGIGVYQCLFRSSPFRQKKTYVPETYLRVHDTQFSFVGSEDKPFVVTIGKITNRSKIAWSSLNIEVTYFDQQGSLIDVLNEDLYPIVVPPQGEATFKVGGLAAANPEEYVRQEIVIKRAGEDRGFP